MSGEFTVVVPCSTSNLGAGFDALGIALGGPDLIVRATPGGSGLRITNISGMGENTLPRDHTNRIIVAAIAAAQVVGVGPEALNAELELHSSIPLKRGLGSSAAAALAGALVGDELVGGTLGVERALAVAVSLEGHPDNVVPCLRGGAQVSIMGTQGNIMSSSIHIARPLRAAIFIPEQELSTEAARAVLPKQVPLADAVFNLSRAALFVAALSQGRYELLGEAMGDRLHQGPRSTLIPWLPALLKAAREAGALGSALSGAGTTVFALCEMDSAHDVARAMRDHAFQNGVPGRAEVVDVGVNGARVERKS